MFLSISSFLLKEYMKEGEKKEIGNCQIIN